MGADYGPVSIYSGDIGGQCWYTVGMSHHTDDLIIQVTVGMWRELTDRITKLEALLPTAELAPVKSTRGTRLPEGWIPEDKWVDVMMLELGCSKGALVREHRKFCDHFYSAPGQKGVKTRWDRAWCNWMRRAAEQGNLGGRRTSPNDDKIRDLMEMDVHAEGE